MTRAFVFPGQASQVVGMGRALAEAFPVARHLLEEVEEALHEPLSRLMFEGPERELTLTENAQPAIMAVSLAVIRVLEAEGGLDVAATANFVAGHSVGEYSALVAARALSVAEAARLLKLRGRAMQQAVPPEAGAMAALVGLDLDQAQAVAEQAAGDDVCACANDNAPGQVVVSGHRQAVERAVAIAAERGARRRVLLPVSAPFHCPLMSPAAEAMAEALQEVRIDRPVPPLVANVTATAVDDPAAIRELLVRQVTSMVRWRECVLYMKDAGVDSFVECGSGRVVTGLVRRIDRDLAAVSLKEPADIEAFLNTV
ncbi:MAG: ACP S-malonyltransferase [Kiloniellales bacterium]